MVRRAPGWPRRPDTSVVFLLLHRLRFRRLYSACADRRTDRRSLRGVERGPSGVVGFDEVSLALNVLWSLNRTSFYLQKTEKRF